MEQPRDTCAAYRVADDLASAFNAALDEVAQREANVGLEGLYPVLVESGAQWRHIRRHTYLQSTRGRAVERLPVGRPDIDAERSCAVRVASANVEVGPLAIVAYAKRAAVLE